MATNLLIGLQFHHLTIANPRISHGAFPWTPGGPIPSGNGFAFSFFNLASVCALLYSITRLCLKYVTYTSSVSLPSASPTPSFSCFRCKGEDLPNSSHTPSQTPHSLSHTPIPLPLCFVSSLQCCSALGRRRSCLVLPSSGRGRCGRARCRRRRWMERGWWGRMQWRGKLRRDPWLLRYRAGSR